MPHPATLASAPPPRWCATPGHPHSGPPLLSVPHPATMRWRAVHAPAPTFSLLSLPSTPPSPPLRNTPTPSHQRSLQRQPRTSATPTPRLTSHPAIRGRKRRGGPVAGCRASALPGQPSRPCATSGHARVGTTAALVCHTRPPSQRTASAQCATPGHYALACLACPSTPLLFLSFFSLAHIEMQLHMLFIIRY